MTVYDGAGRAYDATQLQAPSTINGAPIPAGWWVVTDPYGNRTPCSPTAFPTMFSGSATAPTAPVAPLPTEQLPWTILQNSTGASIPAASSLTWTVTGAGAYRQIAVDVLVLLATGTAINVSVARRWTATGDDFTMDTQAGLATGQSYSQDFGEESHSGRLLGAPMLSVTVTNTAAAAVALVALTIAGR